MLSNVMSMGIVAPNSGANYPYVLSERIPRPVNPTNKMNEILRTQILEQARNKDDNERTFLDYLILAQDKIDQMRESGPLYYTA